MTTLIAWIAVDDRGPSSLYMASDSRITWGSAAKRWDVGRKLFACKRTPDIFGYVGDVLFPSLLLGQLIESADVGLIPGFKGTSEERNAGLKNTVLNSLAHQHDAHRANFEILHVSRNGDGMSSSFHVWRLSYSATTDSLNTVAVSVPTDRSRLIIALGSGASQAKAHEYNLSIADQGRTSQSIFWSFCDALNSKADPLTGGAPQLAGVYRRGNGKTFGVLYNHEYYFHDLPLKEDFFPNSVEWRDELFQVISSDTGQIASESQRHAR